MWVKIGEIALETVLCLGKATVNVLSVPYHVVNEGLKAVAGG